MWRYVSLTVALAALSIPGLAGAVPGENPAGWKLNDNGSHSNSGSYYSGRSHQSYGQQQAGILYSYGKANMAVPKEVVVQHTDAIKASSQAAIKDFEKLKTSVADHPAVVKQIEAVQEHHRQVVAMCEMLSSEAKKAAGDSVKICECCSTITKDLEAAEKKAEALKEPLKVAPPLSPSKAEHTSK